MTFTRLIISLLSITSMSCSSIGTIRSENSYLINEILIRNETYGAIQDAQLKVEKFHGIFGCSYILPNTECSTTFPQRPYEGNLITINWKQNGQAIHSSPMRISIDDKQQKGVVMKSIIIIKVLAMTLI